MTTQVGVAGHIIKRPRLTRILDETDARIILLCAPAGYGKTTLARQWVATREEPVLWYSGGPAMADVAALAVDLAELFGGVDSELVERVRFLASRGEGPRTLAKVLAREAPGEGTLLVVDDYHLAASSRDADALVCDLAELAEFRLVLASRVKPDWVDARKVIYGEARLLEQDGLAFTAEEAELVLPDGSAFLEQAHGWPAVIGLAAATGAKHTAVAGSAPEQLYDFIASALYSTTTESLRMSLLVLGAGGDATREVCRDLLGTSYDVTVRAALDRGFVVRDEGGWIAIHPLLREFLVRRLQDTSVDSRNATVATVLNALRSKGRWDECLRLLNYFPNEALADEILSEALHDLLAAGRTATVEQWAQLARGNSFSAPIFVLAQAEVALRRGRDTEAASLALQAAPRLSGDLAARAYLVAARAAHQSDDGQAVAQNADKAELTAVSPSLKTEALALATASAYEREPDRTREFYNRLQSLDDPRPEHALRVACAAAYLHISSMGIASDALREAKRAVSLSEHVRDPLLRTNAHNLYAHLLRVCAEYEAAVQVADDLAREASETGLDFVIDHALLAKASALVGMRAFGRAQDVLRTIGKRAHNATYHVLGNTALCWARLRIATGDLEAAARHLAGTHPSCSRALLGESLALRAIIEGAVGQLANAQTLLDRANAASRSGEVRPYADLARLVVDVHEGRPEVTADVVRRILTDGNADAVVTACRAFPPIAAAAVAHGAGSELERLFSRSRDADLGRRVGLSMPREMRRRTGLSGREREVYELLIQGRTNAEIANTLFISPSTAKVHIRHIFDKLGVHSRAEAAALAVDQKRSEDES